MNSITRIVTLVAGVVMLLTVTPSWGQPVCVAPGCNPTMSDGNGNTAGGTDALEMLNGGFNNTAFGDFALHFDIVGSRNTAVGAFSLATNASGNDNTATGDSALFSNLSGHRNTATGSAALFASQGNDNTAVGADTLRLNFSGFANTGIGTQALYSNFDASYNTAVGHSALFSNATGSQNTAVGTASLAFNTSGLRNTGLGDSALAFSTGNKNIAIGFKAGFALNSGHNNIYVGNEGSASESQTIRVGTAQTRAFIAGIANTAVGNPATVIIDTTTGQLGIPLSSARYKQDIAPMGNRSEKVLDLRPVTFAYRDDARAITHYGLIAEEVATVYPDLVTRTASGEVQTVKYQELIPMLLNELQRQRHEFQQALQSQQQELAELRALVSQGRGKVVLGGMGE